MYDLLNVLKDVCRNKEIYIKCDDEIAKDYPIVSILYLEEIAKENINNLIFEFFNVKNVEAEKIKNLLNKLIDIEKCFFGRKPSKNANSVVSNSEYAHTIEALEKLKNLNDLLIDKDTKQNISSFFTTNNLKEIEKINKELQLSKYRTLVDIYKNLKTLFEYFNVDKNAKLILDTTLILGSQAFLSYSNHITSKEDLDNLFKCFKDVNYNLIKIKEVFNEYPNSVLKIDDCEILLKNLEYSDLENLSKILHDTTIDSIIELGKSLRDCKFNKENNFDSYLNLLEQLSSFKTNPVETTAQSKKSSLEDSVHKKILKINEKLVQSSKLPLNERVNNYFKNIVGLEDVKQEITDMINFCNKLKSINKFSMANSHMCFIGNPGTGKTTVARIVAELLYEEGFLKNNKVKEVGGVDLQAGYMGQTAQKVQKYIKESEGGILFIDEAYQILNAARDDETFGKEALAVLIKQMEDNPNLMTILAGYEKPTQEMIKVNPGLESRIATTLKFDNYSSEDLIKIARIVASANNFTIDDSAIDCVKKYIEKHIKDDNFANGRFVKNLVVKAEKIQTRRAKTEDFVLLPEDFIKVIEEEQKNKSEIQRPIGFLI